MSSKSRKIKDPEKYLEESGLLFHINRTILHPIGLSLMLSLRESPSGERTTVLELYETDNPYGYVVGEARFEKQEQIYQEFLETVKPKVAARGSKLGFIVQGMED